MIGLLLLAGGTGFLVTTVRHTEDLRHGTRAVGVVQAGEASGGRLRVRFEVGGAPVVAALPGNTDQRLLDAGDRIRIRYDPRNPEDVAAERDIGERPIVLTAGLTAVGLLFTAVFGTGVVLEQRRRREVDARWAAAQETSGPEASAG